MILLAPNLATNARVVSKLCPMLITTLKLVFTIVFQIFIFSPNDNPSKIIKNDFYFIEKALFVFEIFKVL